MNQLTTTPTDTRANLDLARAFADSKMVPEHFKKSIGDCYIAIGLAARYRMDPWTLMQEMYIIQGKPMMSGKLSAAILNNSLAEPLRPEYSGAGDDRTIVLTGRPEGEDRPLSVELKVKDARTQNEQWKKNVDQMLMYSAARMWGRRYTPDILLGIVFDDEEIPGVTAPAQRTPIASPPTQPKGDIIDQLTGEVLDSPAELQLTQDEKWHDWGKRFVTAVRTSPDIDSADQWLAANAEIIAKCEKENTKVHGNILAAVKDFKLSLLNQGEGT
ncbi:hypothetical protein KIP88_03130 [Bradyrhizobium sp. SRL28]|uniref:hypothetical protein n=1 Tax=Bradyrhizobium sp. SRL28 TaxID=2836178 RepID=UPI001BDEA7EE|nr:hypothetical protein [Bradyrhizobium sp. SRL28]MBT1509486.1 hypothetical protein [Bradyrhizobium sp. SRL28]